MQGCREVLSIPKLTFLAADVQLLKSGRPPWPWPRRDAYMDLLNWCERLTAAEGPDATLLLVGHNVRSE